jgi:hypothetical protein
MQEGCSCLGCLMGFAAALIFGGIVLMVFIAAAFGN